MQTVIDTPVEPGQTAPSAGLSWLCRATAAVVASAPPNDIPRRIAGLLPEILPIGRLLTAEQMAAPADGYGRNRLFLCPQDRFSILAMIWPAGVATPIHDHREWCAFGIYRGEIEETRYDPADDAPGCTRAAVRQVLRRRAGAVAHLPLAAPNIHCIRNPTGEPAVSIHVYGGNCETGGPNLDRIYTVEP